MKTLHLVVEAFESLQHWRWVLSDENGLRLGAHEVDLDRGDPFYEAFADLPGYLDYRVPLSLPGGERMARQRALLAEIGEWTECNLFGDLFAPLAEGAGRAPAVVALGAPPAAAELLARPYEVTRWSRRAQARPPVRFVYGVDAGPVPGPARRDGAAPLRILAVFSVPEQTQPLGLRRERRNLQAEIERLAGSTARPIELRVLQYGATRATLRATLAAAEGWDVIHFSGHGAAGEIVLEDEQGGPQRLGEAELRSMLRSAGARTQLVTLSSCLSGASMLRVAVEQLQIDDRAGEGYRQGARAAAGDGGQQPRVSLAHTIARELGCAVLAMRFQVEDELAADLVLGTYLAMLQDGEPLPAALEAGLERVCASSRLASPLSSIAPILLGASALDLRLAAPAGASERRPPPRPATGYPPEPERFVGRLAPLLQAGRALAPASGTEVVVFHGMPGVGKTTCALELAHRQAGERFAARVWHDCSGPLAGPGAPAGFESLRRSLAARGAGSSPEDLLSTLPLLLTIDGLDLAVSREGEWLDPAWGRFFARLAERGTIPSRIVITTRRVPEGWRGNPRVLCLAIPPLSPPEGILLSRQMTNLRTLFETQEGLELLGAVLGAAGGHPGLLQLADERSGDPDLLRRELAAGGLAVTLRRWALELAAALPPPAQRLLCIVARLEEADRDEALLRPLLRFAGRGEPCQEVPPADEGNLGRLLASGLLEGSPRSSALRLHPAVAAAALEAAGAATLAAVDAMLADFWSAVALRGALAETAETGLSVVESSLRALSYLLRGSLWGTAMLLVEQVLDWGLTQRSGQLALRACERMAAAEIQEPLRTLVAGLHARSLLAAGFPAEAEALIPALLERAKGLGEGFVAVYLNWQLVNVYLRTGKYERALALVEENGARIRASALGPRTELGNLGLRLQVLKAQGKNSLVLEEILQVRERVLDLADPAAGEVGELLGTWQAQEGILDTGRSAAHRLQRWQTALDLTTDILRIQESRGAHPATVARTRLNEVGPLFGLGRMAEARAIAARSRPVLERYEDVDGLRVLFSLLATIESWEGQFRQAVDFQEIALLYHYRWGDPEGCSGAHLNLGSFLREIAGEERRSLAHWMACAYLELLAAPATLPGVVLNLARHAAPEDLPSLAEAAAVVEGVRGVSFLALVRSLLPAGQGPGALLREIQERVRRERSRAAGRAVDADASEIPAAVRSAVDRGDIEGLETALLALGLDEASALWNRLELEGKVRNLSEVDEDEGVPAGSYFVVLLQRLQDLVRAVVAVGGNAAAQHAIRAAVLPELERRGFAITPAVVHIWQGERDAVRLTRGLDERSASVVRIVLQAVRRQESEGPG